MKKLLAILPLLIFFVSPFQAHAALTTNLVSYWKLDEASGNAADATGNGHTFTQNNGITYGPGIINNGAQLAKASTQYFTSPDATDLKPTTAISVAAWVKFNSTPASNTPNAGMWLVTKWSGSAGYFLHMDPSFNFYLNINGTQRNAGGYTPPGGTLTGVWYYFVGTYDGTTITLYLNGVSVAAASFSGSIGEDTQQLEFGGNSTSATRNFDGTVDEVGIWSRALTPTEITQLYNSGAGLQYPFTIPATVPYAFANLFSWW